MNILSDCIIAEGNSLFLRKRLNSPSIERIRPARSPRCNNPPKISLKSTKTIISRQSLKTVDSDGPLTPLTKNNIIS